MKMKLLAAVAIALGCVGAATAATTSVPVSASVASGCKVTQSGSVSFTLDPGVANSGSTPSSVQPVKYWCTKGTTITLSAAGANDVSGQKKLKKPGATAAQDEFIDYTFTYSADGATGNGPNGEITLTVGGSVTDTAFTGVSAGTYTDSVTVTITAAP